MLITLYCISKLVLLTLNKNFHVFNCKHVAVLVAQRLRCEIYSLMFWAQFPPPSQGARIKISPESHCRQGIIVLSFIFIQRFTNISFRGYIFRTLTVRNIRHGFCFDGSVI